MPGSNGGAAGLGDGVAAAAGLDDDDVAALTSAVLTASRLLVAVSLRSLAAGRERVTLPQFRLLVLLAGQGELNLVGLAERLAVNPSTALRMVDRLADRGLVERRANPASRREVLLRLTGRGRRVVEEVTVRRREEIGVIVTKMTVRDRAGLVRALRAFAVAGGEPPADGGGRERDPVPLGWD